MSEFKTNLIGELIMYNGKKDIENWVICDGKERDNSDNRYDELIKLELGERKGEKYLPPNYNTMSLFSVDKSDDDIIDILSKQVSESEMNFESILNHHIIAQEGETLDYNVILRSRMNQDETELSNYLSANPEMVLKNIEDFRDNNKRLEMYSKCRGNRYGEVLRQKIHFRVQKMLKMNFLKTNG